MNESSVALLIADNGLGHARRSLAVLCELLRLRPGLDVTVVLGRRTLERVSSLGPLAAPMTAPDSTVRVVPGGVGWPVADDLNERSRRWSEAVSAIDEVSAADLVLSDNYTEVLAIREDAVLVGSFLWSDAFAGPRLPAVAEFAARERSLLAEHRPPMLCVGELATPGVLNQTNAVRLPQMSPSRPSAGGSLGEKVKRRGIGFSIGTTSAAVALAETYVPVLASRYPVSVDPILAGQLSARTRGLVQVVPAKILVNTVKVLVCRPGMGTVTEAVEACVPMVVFAEPGQGEMAHLVRRLPALGLAIGAGIEPDPGRLLKAVNTALGRAYRRMRERLSAQARGGAEAAAVWCTARLTRERVQPW